jgi:hypothetical protein
MDTFVRLFKGQWEEVAELIATSYRLIAAKRLAETVTSPASLGGSV